MDVKTRTGIESKYLFNYLLKLFFKRNIINVPVIASLHTHVTALSQSIQPNMRITRVLASRARIVCHSVALRSIFHRKLHRCSCFVTVGNVPPLLVRRSFCLIADVTLWIINGCPEWWIGKHVLQFFLCYIVFFFSLRIICLRKGKFTSTCVIYVYCLKMLRNEII